MIFTKRDLKEYLNYEKKLYIASKKRDYVLSIISKDYTYYYWKYIMYLRKSEYHFNNCSFLMTKTYGEEWKQNKANQIWHDLMYVYYRHKRNKFGRILQIEIYENNFEKGLVIYHSLGGILINGGARIGKNCRLHGNICIGNKGINEDVPTIGDNVDIGFGTIIIGDIKIGDNTIIAAGSVVVDSFETGNVVIGGIPAKVIRELK